MENSKEIKIYAEGEDWIIRLVSTPINADIILKDGILIVNHELATFLEEQPKLICPIKLETEITNALIKFGIPAHIRGFRYTRDALKVLMMNPNAMDSITKILYPDVAEMFDTTPSKVERAIRHAIEVAWDRGDVNYLNKYFNYPNSRGKAKPTNSEFLSVIAEQLRIWNGKTD
jgi:hypothetical protein